ncbi:MAG: SusC/RagA family TonB-linked outer membrane protein, partial [Cyclobacteriaceae bacterium]|nr:SusC/RagA family TonB-linked outer membrane protein [Cyclobacteriaceae bacterium]
LQSNVVTWNDSFGKHNVSALGGTEVIHRKVRSSSVEGRLFPSDDFTYITSAGIVDQGSSFISENSLLSFLSEGKYDYEGKYFFSGTFRVDGSSRFGQGRRFGYFPSASAGWRISSESFMEKYTFVDEMKLRMSFGYTGNERIGNFGYFGTWSASTYSGASGTGPEGVGNPELQWERTREGNVGLDISFFTGKIQVTLDAYDNFTDNLLLDRQLPYTTGFASVTGNIGNVSNRGIEMNLSTVNLDDKLKWRTSFNLSRNVNKVVSLADTLPIYRGYGASGASATSVVQVGQPLGTFWGLEFLGVDPATGDAIYSDINGDGTINDDDATVLGNAQPFFIGGLTNTFAYRDFDLNIFFQFSYGNKLLNFSNTALVNTGEDIENNQSVIALKRWRDPGDIASVPRYELGNTYNNRHSSRFIEDGSYLRIKNISLGYNVPLKWITKLHLKGVRVYASATNLLTLTNYSGGDPEVSTLDGSTSAQGTDLFTLPQVRTLMMGVRFKL